jgi:hypothetical protein
MIGRHCTPPQALKGHENDRAPGLTSDIFFALLKRSKSSKTLSNSGNSHARHLLEYPSPIDENTGEVSFESFLKKETIIR